ncbi:MAG: alpha/beta fold hydrolase, partial [Pseudomonadota bacterium]
TPLALVYLHGFSASKAELRPVPERVAAAVGANLFFTRLTGHGRDGAAMATARASNWMGDVSEAIAVGQAIGERVVVIGSSMGGALAALAAAQLEDDAAMAGYVLISPAFETLAGGTSLLTMPFARVWLPWLIGAERSWVPHNAAHAEGWTPAYPSAAVVPFGAVVLEAQLTPYDHVTRPLLLLISDEDAVIDPARARQVAGGWGGAVEIEALALGPQDDPDRHVLAGDALSPGMTEAATARIVAWIEARLAGPPSGQDGGDGDGGEAEEGG